MKNVKINLKKDKNKEGRAKINIVEPPLKLIDYILFILIAIVCFIIFKSDAVADVVAASYAYLKGHILDFYDYNAARGISDVYLPSTYIVYALWNLPLYILGKEYNPELGEISLRMLFWNNMLTCVVFVMCALLVYKIACEIGMGKAKSKLCAFAFLSMPIGFFTVFILGYSDVFALVFILAGVYFWLKEKYLPFILFFAVAITFNFFAFAIMLPLLLLSEKRLLRIIPALILAALPLLIEYCIYLPCDAFKENLVNFSVMGNINDEGIMTGMSQISLVMLVCGITAMYAYFKNITLKEERVKWAFYLVVIVLFSIMGLNSWQPQWLMIMIPFFTISAFINNDTRIFMLLDLVLMLFFVIFMVNEYTGVVDEAILMRGSLGEFIPKEEYYKLYIKDILVYQDKNVALAFYTVLLLVMAVFKHPGYSHGGFKTNVEKGLMGIIRTRFLCGVAIFILPAVLFVIVQNIPPYITFYTPEIHENIGGMIDREVTQVFVAANGELDSISFPVGTYDRENEVTLKVDVRDATTLEVLFSKSVDMEYFEDNDWLTIDTNNLKLVKGGTYRIDISCYDADEDDCVTLYRTEDMGTQSHGYAIVGGERQDYHLCLKIMEN